MSRGEITINGVPQKHDKNRPLSELLARYETQGAVAVAVNERLVTRSDWARYEVKASDRIEILRAVVGG